MMPCFSFKTKESTKAIYGTTFITIQLVRQNEIFRKIARAKRALSLDITCPHTISIKSGTVSHSSTNFCHIPYFKSTEVEFNFANLGKNMI